MSITKKSLINNRNAAKKAVIARASAGPSSPMKSVAAPLKTVAAPMKPVAAPFKPVAAPFKPVAAPLKSL